MIRQPPAAISIANKDVEELAALQSHVLKAKFGQAGTCTPTKSSTTPIRRPAELPRDGHREERIRRQHMTLQERIGL
ncbi:hypothetical protein EC988_003846 [Linderina pennispora]|nr:hypothetical protein EC988_003846 [Linderina pennispora]